jgi:hypothetical protein
MAIFKIQKCENGTALSCRLIPSEKADGRAKRIPANVANNLKTAVAGND